MAILKVTRQADGLFTLRMTAKENGVTWFDDHITGLEMKDFKDAVGSLDDEYKIIRTARNRAHLGAGKAKGGKV